MTATGQETLLDYTPTQEEEVARLTKLAEEQTARVEALFSDPAIQQAEASLKLLEKKIKELMKLRESLKDITSELTVVVLPELDEPKENGFYILTKSEKGYKGQIRTTRDLLLKAMGEWFDLGNNGNTVSNSYLNRSQTFHEFLEIDQRVVEIKIERLEDESVYPHKLLAEIDRVDVGIDEDKEGDDE